MILADQSGRGVVVAVVDSGIAPGHPGVGELTRSLAVDLRAGVAHVGSCAAEDRVGHGTACGGIIRSKAPDAELVSVRILGQDLAADGRCLAAAIDWCTDNGVRVANLSLGTTSDKHRDAIERACVRANRHGLMLVCAGHPEGAVCYPASFDCVFSVTGGKPKHGANQKYCYFHRDGKSPEFVARGDRQRVAWLEPQFLFMGGNSFAAAHLSGIISLILEADPEIDFAGVLKTLVEHASPGPYVLTSDEGRVPRRSATKAVSRGAVLEKPSATVAERDLGWMKRIALYPFNKEMHSFVRFPDLLDCELVGIADPIGKGLIGKEAGEAIGAEPLGITITQNLETAWAEADTLVIGHVDQLGRIAGRNVLKEISEKALRAGKNVYSFSPLREFGDPEAKSLDEPEQLQFAHSRVIGEKDLSAAFHEKEALPDCDVPVVGVFGTGPEQGKFTTQLTLRRKLLERGYDVGQIGTEQHAELFGFDVSFANGYSSESDLMWNMHLHIPFLQAAMRRIALRSPEIIVVGGQSGIAPHDFRVDSEIYTLPSVMFLLGTQPDAYVLMVNSVDSDSHILACMQVLEGLGKGKTILLAMSDKEKETKRAFGVVRRVTRQMTENEINVRLAQLEDRFGIPATEVVSRAGQEKLLDVVVRYFAAEQDP